MHFVRHNCNEICWDIRPIIKKINHTNGFSNPCNLASLYVCFLNIENKTNDIILMFGSNMNLSLHKLCAIT